MSRVLNDMRGNINTCREIKTAKPLYLARGNAYNINAEYKTENITSKAKDVIKCRNYANVITIHYRLVG